MNTRVAGAVAAAVALTALLPGVAHARDVVRLRNGSYIEGEILEETREVVVLKVGKGVTRLPRSDVVRIQRDRELPTWEALFRKKLKERLDQADEPDLSGASAAPLEEAGAASGKDGKNGKNGKNGKSAQRLAQLVERLAAEDPDERREAAALLEREGRKAAPVLTKALFHRNAFARESAARILGKVKARESVRAMIIALRSSVPATERIRPWQRPFVRALVASISAATGKDFGVSLYGTHQGKVAEKYVTWWDGEAPAKPDETPQGACVKWDTPQVGEAPVAEDDPERDKKLWEARRIAGERHGFTPPPSFTANPFGDAEGAGTDTDTGGGVFDPPIDE